MKRQEFLDGPAVVSDASGHCRRGPATGVGQTRMGCAEIIDRPDQIHTMLKRQRVARQRTTAACQRGQTRTEGRVQSLDVRRIDDAVARSEEHTSELQSQSNLVCRLLLEKKKKTI